MAPDYDHLTLMEKVEVFEHAVNNTAGDDLAKLLWLKSPSSEVRCCSSLLCQHCRELLRVLDLFSICPYIFFFQGKMSRVLLIGERAYKSIHVPIWLCVNGVILDRFSLEEASQCSCLVTCSEIKWLFSVKNGFSGLYVLLLKPGLWFSLRDLQMESNFENISVYLLFCMFDFL